METSSADLFDFSGKGRPVDNGARRHFLEFCAVEEAFPPCRRLKGDQHLAEGAVQRDFARIGFDNPRLARTVAPVYHDSLVALQDREAAILARAPRKFLYDRMNRGQRLFQGFEACR